MHAPYASLLCLCVIQLAEEGSTGRPPALSPPSPSIPLSLQTALLPRHAASRLIPEEGRQCGAPKRHSQPGTLAPAAAHDISSNQAFARLLTSTPNTAASTAAAGVRERQQCWPQILPADLGLSERFTVQAGADADGAGRRRGLAQQSKGSRAWWAELPWRRAPFTLRPAAHKYCWPAPTCVGL